MPADRVPNPWVSRLDPPAACWEATLPPPSGRGGLEALAGLAAGLLSDAAEQRVYGVEQLPDGRRFGAAGEYAGWLLEALEARGELPLFDFGGGGAARTPEGQLLTPGVVCVHQEGRVVEREVSDMGALLEALRPDDVDGNERFFSPFSPLTLLGGPVRAGDPSPVRLRVLLYTDIWLPWVFGFLEEEWPAPNVLQLFDNRELASCHTPRLNRFLEQARRRVEAAGGTWALADQEPGAEDYAIALEPEGVLLD